MLVGVVSQNLLLQPLSYLVLLGDQLIQAGHIVVLESNYRALILLLKRA